MKRSDACDGTRRGLSRDGRRPPLPLAASPKDSGSGAEEAHPAASIAGGLTLLPISTMMTERTKRTKLWEAQRVHAVNQIQLRYHAKLNVPRLKSYVEPQM